MTTKTHIGDGCKTACGMDEQWGRGNPPAIDNSYPTGKACLRSANRVSKKVHNDATGTWSYRK